MIMFTRNDLCGASNVESSLLSMLIMVHSAVSERKQTRVTVSERCCRSKILFYYIEGPLNDFL